MQLPETLFEKKIEKFSNFLFLRGFQWTKMSFLLPPVEEKVVFGSYANPFGYFLAL